MGIFIKPFIISLTFLAGFALIDAGIINRIKQKKIYSFFIALGYFIIFWVMIYIFFQS